MSTKYSQLFLPQLGNRSSLNPSCFKEKQRPVSDFPEAKVAGIPKSPIRVSAKNPKTAAVPLPDDPDIKGTGCLSLQIRGGVFVADSLADVPESGEAPGENRRFSSRALLSFRRHIQTPLGCLMGCVCPHKNIVEKGKCAGVGASPAPLCKGSWLARPPQVRDGRGSCLSLWERCPAGAERASLPSQSLRDSSPRVGAKGNEGYGL